MCNMLSPAGVRITLLSRPSICRSYSPPWVESRFVLLLPAFRVCNDPDNDDACVDIAAVVAFEDIPPCNRRLESPSRSVVVLEWPLLPVWSLLWSCTLVAMFLVLVLMLRLLSSSVLTLRSINSVPGTTTVVSSINCEKPRTNDKTCTSIKSITPTRTMSLCVLPDHRCRCCCCRSRRILMALFTVQDL